MLQRTGIASKWSTLGGFGAIVLWSTTIAFARSTSEQVGALRAAGAIYGVSASLVIVSLAISPARRRQIRELPPGPTTICGLLFVGYMVALYLAIGLAADRAQTLVVALLNYLWPPLTILLSLRLLGARANLLIWPATGIAIIGVYLVLAQGNDASIASLSKNLTANPVAYLLAASAALAWALYSNLTRRWAPGSVSAVASGLFLCCTAAVMASMGAMSQETGEWTRRALAEAVFLGVVNYLAYTLWDIAMRRGNLTLVAAGSYLTPLLSTAVTCLYLQVVPGASLVAGCVLLVAGSVISWLSVKGPADGEARGS